MDLDLDTTAQTLAELRRQSQSIYNRIQSIAEDARFVARVHDSNYKHWPIIPNMRCGAWYTEPTVERAYFKSTDGHTNNWSFNLRRPNLHILPLIVQHAGLVLVDSTRAGKRIPDALSKTVPIWCAVINRALVKRASRPEDWDTTLYTSPGCVSPQEHRQIEAKLGGWASELAASSYTLPALERPLRPIWITPASTVLPSFPSDGAFYPIICVSASKQVTDGMERRASGFAYIQGSGDDHELWSMGLTPTLYWAHRDRILSSGPDDLPDLVRSLVASAHTTATDDATEPGQRWTAIERVSGRLAISTLAILDRPVELLQTHPSVAFVRLTPPTHDPDPLTTQTPSDEATPKFGRMLCIPTPDGKKGQHHFLSVVLPSAMTFIQYHLQNERIVCIACGIGTDLAIGVALAALALFFRPDGSCCTRGDARDGMSKDVPKTRLQWIISSYPRANPSRTTLKRVNDFLLSPSFHPPPTLGHIPGSE